MVGAGAQLVDVLRSVAVPVMQVRVVRMTVPKRRVRVVVGMRLGRRRPRRMVVLVVLVVAMRVVVRE